jgi:L-lactate dehydrogenase complex protein LldG
MTAGGHTTAREEILTKVTAAIAGAEQRGPVPREYRTTTDDDLETFLDRLAHYDAVTHVVHPRDVDATISSALRDRTRVVVPDAWTTAVDDPLTDDPPLTYDQLDAAQGVLTTCALAIAQTGTIVLDGGVGMGRRALTLLPDYHLCVVRHEQIVPSVPEAISKLGGNDPTRPITFVSGPSATVDIEMTRVRGVHGPRNLEVIIAAAPQTDPAT